MTPQEALVKAAELIEQPGKWTQGSYAKDKDGDDVLTSDPAAVCFCAAGALYHVTPAAYAHYRAARKLFKEAVGESVTTFNDTPGRTAQEVAAAMRKAACAPNPSEPTP